MPNEKRSGGNRKYFSTLDLTFLGIFSALWIVLHLTIGPLGFALLHLPVLCDVAAYLTLLLAIWIIGKFGGASIVGIMGSIVLLFFRPGSYQIFGFAASAIFLDALFLATRHKAPIRPVTLVATVVITTVSAYSAGVIIGLVFMAGSLDWALTFWGGWHAIGGLLSVLITLPIVISLEKAGVRRLMYANK